jgi:diguanylate cyclase (GGDEF)-like protein
VLGVTVQHAAAVELLDDVGDLPWDCVARSATRLTGCAAATVELEGLHGSVLLAAHGPDADRLHLVADAPALLDDVRIGAVRVHDLPARTLGAEQHAGLADLAGLVVAMLRGRLDRRRADAARADLVTVHEMLVEMQAFDQALLDALPVGVIAVGPTGQVLRFNRRSQLWDGQVGVAASLSEDLASRYRFFHPDGTTPLPIGELPLAQALASGSAVRRELAMRPTGQPPVLVDCVSTPVRLPDGALIGAVLAMDDVTERRAMEERLRTAALHDGLTGLPNRSLLADRLEQALLEARRSGTRIAVLYCDLDGFKSVNDGFGHTTGDQVLVAAAARLSATLRPGDTVARLGGDEFVLMCPRVEDAADAAVIAERVTAAMAAPVPTPAGDQQVGISVGLVLSQPDSTPETLLTAADEAMYAVKRHRQRTTRRR